MSEPDFGRWQDMAGAPRDGTRILVELRASEQGPAEVDMVRWARDRTGIEGWMSAESDPGAAVFYEEPELSGWMPLPAPLPKIRAMLKQSARERATKAELDGSGI